MNYGIIFEGERSPVVSELAYELRELGLTRYEGDTLNSELLDSLNDYRRANYMKELDFCDPAVLRALGIRTEGDEIITMALCAESISKNEIDCYNICRKIVSESEKSGMSLTESALHVTAGSNYIETPSPEAVVAALLAFIGR